MAGFLEIARYKRSRELPVKDRIHVPLKQHDAVLELQIPDFGVTPLSSSLTSHDVDHSLSCIFQEHLDFKRLLTPSSSTFEDFESTCQKELLTISLFFPDIHRDDIRLVFAAWLAFACAMDDHLELLPPQDREVALLDAMKILEATRGVTMPALKADAQIQRMIHIFKTHCSQHLSASSCIIAFRTVSAVLQAHIDESKFLNAGALNDLPAYMSIRRRTIALTPFFELLKHEYLPDTADHPAWELLQTQVSTIAGLQNDLVGLERDMENGEGMNAVLVLMRAASESEEAKKPQLLADCVAAGSQLHNEAVERALALFDELCQVEKVREVARNILMLSQTHLMWCTSAKRYKMKNEQSPQPEPVQTICNKSIFLGLPTYPDTPQFRGLTAIVTGATGVSGYHMVKVLAASERWTKIYALSRREPPGNFFADLGASAMKVMHLKVDFLDEPEKVAETLATSIPKVDHVFFFSYLQPAPKGDVLDLWSNAEEVAQLNITLLNNFLAALHQTPYLRPKRILLQTGSKHYAFYLGPAPLPAFESDPRVTFAPNFYYAQEDALSAFCASIPDCSYTIARPSWIIGAVADGSLNHLIAFGIYASVCAYLGEPITFPGGYDAWDREMVQSSATLNAYFEEFLVLNDTTKNEAFNIHDGQSFTWGRLWPMLAEWYGVVRWEPPSTDESKYRVTKLPYPQTPRGYGPQATLRSTFSLLEWSLKPQVTTAWATIAQKHKLTLNPFDDAYRARIFSFADAAIIGDAPMTLSIRKARQFGFFGTTDSYRGIFDTLRELERLGLIVAPTHEFVE